MPRSDGLRRLVAVGVLAILAAGSSHTYAQSPFLNSSGISTQPSAGDEHVLTPLKGTEAEPTPEEVGDALMLHQRYQAAIAAYQQASQDSSDVWNKMGIAHQMMLNLQEASRCYRASLKINPDNSHVLNNLGTVYESEKRYGDAERMYRKSIRLAPRSALAYRNLGTALLDDHNYKDGWAAYQTALSLDPQIFLDRTNPKIENPGSALDRGAMNFYMAKGCVRAGMNECAIDHLRRALNEGFTSQKKIVADSEFAGLRDVPAFQQLLAEQGRQ